MDPQPLLSWQDYEYPFEQKDPQWFLAFGIIAGAGVVVALLLKNFLLAALIVIAALLIMLFALRRPELVTFEITRVGVRAKRSLYPFKELEAFSIYETNEQTRLLLQSRHLLTPLISLPLRETDAERVRDLLKDILEERDLRESFAVHLFERLGL